MEKKTKSNKFILEIIMFFCALLALYIGISIYFINHFYFGTEINCVDVSGKTEEEAEKEILNKEAVYTLVLEGRYNMKEVIKGSDIKLKYNLGRKIIEVKNTQNPFGWVISLVKVKKYKNPEIVSYNEESLKNLLDKSVPFDSSNVINPKNPTLEYTNNGYVIVNEVMGNKVDKKILYENVVKAINMGETKLDLDLAYCYENPKYTANSKEVVEAKNILDKYTSLTITYTIGDKIEIVDGSIIRNWVKVDADFNVKLDKSEIENYVDNLGGMYNTAGITRDFRTSLGIEVKVSGGTYGWIINKSEEVRKLIELIQEGKSITREPIYKQKALYHGGDDIGNTYVEINLKSQHLWFYKNGLLVVDGNIVTGNVDKGYKTPEGTYMLQYKEKNATLKGEDYRTQVKFWMPFYGNIGIHDASWREAFGGKIFISNGSHGCVNAPLFLANIIFNNIEEGTPIICYS